MFASANKSPYRLPAEHQDGCEGPTNNSSKSSAGQDEHMMPDSGRLIFS
jgi:hypothetical protein